jgi:hypothetical protein
MRRTSNRLRSQIPVSYAKLEQMSMKQPGVIVALIVFVAAVSFVLASQQRQNERPLTAVFTTADRERGGSAKFVLNLDQSELCYQITVSGRAQHRIRYRYTTPSIQTASSAPNSPDKLRLALHNKSKSHPTEWVVH